METKVTTDNTKISQKHKELYFDIITYTFIMLFTYAAFAKIQTFDSFIRVLERSPLIGSFNKLAAYFIITTEISISLLLVFNKTKKMGMWLSLFLMIIFTIYLIYMVSLGGKLPCMCGGVISTLTWQQHIWFNLFFVGLALIGVAIHPKDK